MNILSITFATILLSFYLSLANAGLTWKQIENIMTPMRQKCAEKTGLTPELKAAHEQKQFPNDRILKCYLHCLEQTGKVIDKNDKIDIEGTLKRVGAMMPEENREGSRKAYTECYERIKHIEDGCELAYQYAVCYVEIDPDSYML